MNIRKKFLQMLTCISPTLNTRVIYFFHFHKRCNLRHPQTFEEKICWLKLYQYNNDPLVAICADKYQVRSYVKEKGCEKNLNKVIAVYKSPKDIDWKSLPNQFVLKWNFGATFNFVCKNKNNIDADEIIQKFEKWGKEKWWLDCGEMQYRDVPKVILCEEYLEDKEHKNSLPDYKLYCFHGEPLAILVMHDRDGILKREFFDTKWNRLPNPPGIISPKMQTPKPTCLNELISVARKLSNPFPFVRCDLYIVNSKIYFGEMTFTPAGGIFFKHTLINNIPMTEYLHLPV